MGACGELIRPNGLLVIQASGRHFLASRPRVRSCVATPGVPYIRQPSYVCGSRGVKLIPGRLGGELRRCPLGAVGIGRPSSLVLADCRANMIPHVSYERV